MLQLICGLFYNLLDLDDITSRFRVDRPRDLSLPLRYNVAPSQSVPVIRIENEERELALMRWGSSRIGRRTRRSGTR